MNIEYFTHMAIHGPVVTFSGRASRHLISTLLSSPECPAIRAIARSDANIQATFPPQLRSAAHFIIVADHFQGEEFESAFRGVSIIFHNSPSVHTRRGYELRRD